MLNIQNLTNINNLALKGGEFWYSASSLRLNGVLPTLIHEYDNNRYYSTSSGQTSFPFTSVRAGNATMFDNLGRLVWAPANFAQNTVGAGAVVGVIGSGGALPTGWNWAATGAGVVREVVAIGTAPNGDTYIDVRLSGTNTSGSTVNPHVQVITPTMTAGLVPRGQLVTFSMTTQLIAGTLNASTTGRLGIQWRTSAGGYISEISDFTSRPTSSPVRASVFASSAPSTSDRVTAILAMSVLDGETVDCTIRMYSPQLEYTGVDSPKPYNSNASTSSAYFGPRLDYNPATFTPRGLLVEETRTNQVPNSSCVGGVDGTPGTLPTGWVAPATITGVTRSLAFGTEDGLPYCDITLSGTNTSGSAVFIALGLTPSNTIAAANGQTWSHSVFARKVAGTTAESEFRLNLMGRTAAFAPIAGQEQSITLAGGATLAKSRISGTYTFSDATVAFAQLRLTRSISLADGASIDITIRISGAQLELGSFATSYIPTFATAATRASESVSSASPATLFNTSTGTMFTKSTQIGVTPAGAYGIACFNDGTSGNMLGNRMDTSSSVAAGIATSGGVNQTSLQRSIGALTPARIVHSYEAGTRRRISVNGLSINQQAGYTAMAAPTIFSVGNYPTANPLNGHISRIIYWPTASASDAQLQSLTA